MAPPNPEPSPQQLAASLEQFLSHHPRAALLEDGRVLFEMASSCYSISAEHGRCVLHLWSEERNLVRTVVGLTQRKESLRLTVRRLGASRPQSLHLAPDRDQRTPAARTLVRNKYLRLMERVLTRYFNEYKIDGLRTTMDLEKSFGPAYARGMLLQGQHLWAVLGVNAEETQATIDAALTAGILWLSYCREHGDGKRLCHGLKIIVPEGSAATIKARMAWLNRELAHWELYELTEATEELTRIDTSGEGNLNMRLVHAFNPQAAIERAQPGIDRVMQLLPEGMRGKVTIVAKSSNHVALSLHGLEFARVRQGFAPDSFVSQSQVTFGAGPHETPLHPETEEWFIDLVTRLFASRHPAGRASDPLFRLQPEGWLQSILLRELTEIEPGLQSSMIYSQVPAFAAGDRAMLDLLTVARNGRLAVLELKAEEDLQLPLQGLDYWIRVHRLQEERGPQGESSALERNGYFPGVALSRRPPLLYFILPALRIHPTMETILRHLSPQIEWRLIALNESWREERQVVFRKRGGSPQRANPESNPSADFSQ